MDRAVNAYKLLRHRRDRLSADEPRAGQPLPLGRGAALREARDDPDSEPDPSAASDDCSRNRDSFHSSLHLLRGRHTSATRRSRAEGYMWSLATAPTQRGEKGATRLFTLESVLKADYNAAKKAGYPTILTRAVSTERIRRGSDHGAAPKCCK